MKVHVETDRIVLREIKEDDVEEMFALDSNPEVHRYLGNRPINNRDEARKIISHIRRQYVEFGIGRWALIEKSSNSFAGWAGLKWETGLRADAYYDLGYRLKQEYWGRGLATEAAFESLRYGFEKMNPQKIGAAAHIENKVSNRILRKLGFKHLGDFTYEESRCHWYELENRNWNSASTDLP